MKKIWVGINMRNKVDEIVKFIKSYVNDSQKEGVVLGLSGGIDSAIVAVLAKKALGSKSMYCYYLPEEIKPNSFDFDKQHIEKLCERFDLTYESFEISSLVELYEKKIPIVNDKIGLGNIKARIRMNILYALARKRKCLVIGTTNKSEWEIGYFTKYGDGAADFEPILHLYKTEIFELAKYLDIPNEIIDKKPTAGLWEGQTDEGELNIIYKHLDDALVYINGEWEGGFIPPKNICYVKDLIKRAEHKKKIPKSLRR